MGTSPGRRPRLGRRDAKRLLSDRSGDTDCPELARVLRAASGPAHADELADELATRAGFSREHRSGGGVAGTRYRPPRRVRRTALALRLAVTLAVLLSAGIAGGSATGTLPTALQQRAYALFGSRDIPAIAPNNGISGRPGGVSGAEPSLGSPGLQPVTGVPSSGRVVGWCHAHREGRQSPGGRDFADLASAAGGTEKISSFCAAVLSAAASRRPSTSPVTRTSHPTKPTKISGPPSSKAAPTSRLR